GAHGSRHRDEAFGDPYELPADRAYAETCAAIASVQWNWRMLLATDGTRYADELERALYNAVAGSTSLDGEHFFYSNPLHLRTGHDGSEEDAPSQRLAWYSCACCPPNLARLIASLHGYTTTTDHDGVQVHLYSAGTIRTEVDGSAVEITTRTDYPWHGRVELTVTA
ncbi:beta-L-arabinofuranosidase domain-containing protein, partial [Saccharothrix xinjiangensis]